MRKIFVQFENIVAAVSDRSDGNQSFKIRGDDDVVANRERYLKSLNLKLPQLITASQPHKNRVITVDQSYAGRGATQKDNWLEGYEAMVTAAPGVVLGIETADCLPVFFFDPEKRVVALAHAGWRSVVRGVSINVIKTMREGFDSRPADVAVYIGPHIQKESFEIKDDVVQQFMRYPERLHGEDGSLFVDLSGIVVDQLLSEGCEAANIKISEIDTKTNTNFYSYRREGRLLGGAQLSVIGLL